MRVTILLFSLCLLIFSGPGLNAQNKKEELQQLADRHYNIRFSKMSEDGRWSTIRKLYDRNHDTIQILDNRYPEKEIIQRVSIGEHFFPDNDHLLSRNRESAELWNLQKQTGVCYEHVKEVQIIKSNGLFVLHYNEKVNDRVGLYSISGRLQQCVDRATKFIVSEDMLYVIAREDEEKYQLFRLTDKDKVQLYSSPRKIEFLDIYPEQQGIIIHERNSGSTTMYTSYLDIKTKMVYPLQEVLDINPQRVFTEPIEGKESYFLRVVVDYQKRDTSFVDIWHGDDYQLEKKFYPHPIYAHYVWEPGAKQIAQIGKDQSTEIANLRNGRYFLSFDRFLLQDYLNFSQMLQVDIYDLENDTYSLMDTVKELYSSPGGEYLLYCKDNDWYSYRVDTGTKKIINGNQLHIPYLTTLGSVFRPVLEKLRTPYFTPEGKSAFFVGDDGWWIYDLKENRLSRMVNFQGYRVMIVNGTTTMIIPGTKFNFITIDPEKPILLRLFDPNENKNAYILHHKGRNETLIPFTEMKIRELNYNEKYKHFCYIEENYNCPPRIVHSAPGKEKNIVFQSNKGDKDILSLIQETISYTNSEDIPLKGILYYPLNYSPSGKYPMVVRIYELQSHLHNRYPLVEFSAPNSDGFSIRTLLEKGYFVYFPDIVYGEKGTGLSALDCVNHALDALESNRNIDKKRIGLFGFSHGGYETNFIATHSDRFAAYIAGAGNCDIVRSYFSYNYNFTSPFYWQFENGQYAMKQSFSEDKQLYFQNNPIHYVDKVNAPVLIYTGKRDRNIYWEQTMEFYIGLKRNRKKVVALFYPEEGHTFFSQEACNDISLRILNWFDYYLKGKKDTKWIEQ